jgi:hypothetical protein
MKKSAFFTIIFLFFISRNIFAADPEPVAADAATTAGQEPATEAEITAVEAEPAIEPEMTAEPEPLAMEAETSAEPEPPAAGETEITIEPRFAPVPPHPLAAAEETPAAQPAGDSDPAGAESPAPARPFIVFHEGLSASWLTRITKQTGRSNFVFQDFLPGVYFGMALVNVKYVTPTIRLTAYYPLTSTFNKIPQPPKTPLHFGADFFGGPAFQIDKLKYIRFNLTPGLHLMFLNSDRWNYFNLGAAGLVGFELPVTRGWTVLINGIASLDNGNLGANRLMEPFDIVYQFQVDFGVRYSKKLSNSYSYIKQRTKQQKPPVRETVPPPVAPEEQEPDLPLFPPILFRSFRPGSGLPGHIFPPSHH